MYEGLLDTVGIHTIAIQAQFVYTCYSNMKCMITHSPFPGPLHTHTPHEVCVRVGSLCGAEHLQVLGPVVQLDAGGQLTGDEAYRTRVQEPAETYWFRANVCFFHGVGKSMHTHRLYLFSCVTLESCVCVHANFENKVYIYITLVIQ